MIGEPVAGAQVREIFKESGVTNRAFAHDQIRYPAEVGNSFYHCWQFI
jgi:hypothetical protein